MLLILKKCISGFCWFFGPHSLSVSMMRHSLILQLACPDSFGTMLLLIYSLAHVPSFASLNKCISQISTTTVEYLRSYLQRSKFYFAHGFGCSQFKIEG